jgi:hypothetical protein
LLHLCYCCQQFLYNFLVLSDWFGSFSLSYRNPLCPHHCWWFLCFFLSRRTGMIVPNSVYCFCSVLRPHFCSSCSLRTLHVFRILHTGYCLSVVVANTFLTASLFFRTGIATFPFLTRIRFVLTIADNF